MKPANLRKPRITSLLPEAAPTPGPAATEPVPPQNPQSGSQVPQPTQFVPLAIALPQETRRVREIILPAWYHHLFTAGAADPAVNETVAVINATLTVADHGMITQDVSLMQLAWRTLSGYRHVPAPAAPATTTAEEPSAEPEDEVRGRGLRFEAD